MENKAVQRVKTPQELVHIKHNISAVQYKYWFILIKIFQEFLSSGVEPDKDGFYSVPIAELEKMMGYDLRRKYLKDDLFALSGTAIAFNYLEKNGKEVFYGASFLPEFKVYSKTLKFILPSFIKNILMGDEEIKKMFLVMDWNIFNSFNGKYEAIIYKLCKDYIGVGKTKYFTIEAYRDYIGLKDDEYISTDDFTKRCLRNPVKKINENELSDIIITIVYKKQGRKLIGLHFEMEYKKDKPVLEIAPLEPNPAFEKCLIPINPQKQIEYLTRYSEEQIKAIINYVNAQNEQKEIKNLGGYYAKAFENGWGLDNWEAEQKAKAEEEEKKRQEKAKREAKRKAEQEAKEREEQEKAERERCFAVFEALPIEEQEAILDQVEAETMPFMANLFKKDRKNGLKPYRKPPHYFVLVKIMQAKNL